MEETLAAPRVTSSQHEQLLNTIDQIRAQGISRHIDIPQIVVCGDQSSGKSSVLEAICGLRFEVGDGLCTVFATEYILRRSDQESVSISIHPDRDFCDENHEENLRRWQPSTKDLSQFGTIMAEAREAMGIREGGKKFSTDRLCIEVSGPTQPHLSLVDVPGLFHTPGRDQTTADRDAITELVKGYIKNPRSIIMAVISAKSDPELQITLTFAHDQDPEGKRTIGVITKPDTLSRNSPNEQRYFAIAQNKDTSAHFKLGWAIVRNRGFEERESTTRERDENEKRFFDAGLWRALNPSLKGVQALRIRLGKILHDHIITELPSMLMDVQVGIDDCQQKLEALGSSRVTFEEQRLYLHRASSRYVSLMSASNDAIYGDAFFGSGTTDVDFQKRIRATSMAILNEFGDEMRLAGHAVEIVPANSQQHRRISGTPRKVTAQDFYDNVKILMKRNGGRELPGLFNPAIIQSLFLVQCEPWQLIVEKTLEDLLAAARTTSRLVLEQVADEATVDKVLLEIVNPRMEPIEQSLRQKVYDILKPILSGHPMTFNDYFVANIQKKRENEMRKEFSIRISGLLGKDPRSSDASARRFEGSFDVAALLDALVVRTEKDMEQFAAVEATNAMLAYYKVALKRIVDHFAIYVVDSCLLEKLPGLFDPEVILDLDEDTIKRIAGESEEAVEQRKMLEEKLHALKETQKIAHNMLSRRPQDTAARRMILETPNKSGGDAYEDPFV